jgi:hypothetical protein
MEASIRGNVAYSFIDKAPRLVQYLGLGKCILIYMRVLFFIFYRLSFETLWTKTVYSCIRVYCLNDVGTLSHTHQPVTSDLEKVSKTEMLIYSRYIWQC